jgi:hypothetical protein
VPPLSASQFHEPWGRSAAVRVGRQSNHPPFWWPGAHCRCDRRGSPSFLVLRTEATQPGRHPLKRSRAARGCRPALGNRLRLRWRIDHGDDGVVLAAYANYVQKTLRAAAGGQRLLIAGRAGPGRRLFEMSVRPAGLRHRDRVGVDPPSTRKRHPIAASGAPQGRRSRETSRNAQRRTDTARV